MQKKHVSKIFKKAIRPRFQMFADHSINRIWFDFDLIPLTHVFQYDEQNSLKMVSKRLMPNYTMMEHMFCS